MRISEAAGIALPGTIIANAEAVFRSAKISAKLFRPQLLAGEIDKDDRLKLISIANQLHEINRELEELNFNQPE